VFLIFFFTAPLDQDRYITLSFIHYVGPNNLITVCPGNLVAV